MILSDLNAVVFEYLVIEGFSEAAVEFARETGLPHDVDHTMIRERMTIREAVEDGRVEEAVRRVNELDPEVSNQFLRCRNPRMGEVGPQGYKPSCTTLSQFYDSAMRKHLISQT